MPGEADGCRVIDRRLLDAAFAGNSEAARALVRLGASPNVTTASGRSALCDAAEMDRPDVLKLLIELGADVDAAAPDGWTALHHAVDAEGDFHHQAGTPLDLRLIGPLLNAGANPLGPRDRHGSGLTPLELARQYGHDAAVAAFESAANRNRPS